MQEKSLHIPYIKMFCGKPLRLIHRNLKRPKNRIGFTVNISAKAMGLKSYRFRKLLVQNRPLITLCWNFSLEPSILSSSIYNLWLDYKWPI